MSWTNALRLLDIAVIGLSAGFAVSLWWVLDSWRIDRPLKVARGAFLLSYLLYSLVAMSWILFAANDDQGFTWRTALATAAAAAGVFASWWSWRHWHEISEQMGGGVRTPRPPGG